VRYLGIDWGYRRAAFCALGEGGAIAGGGFIAADEGGLTRLVLACGTGVRACVEMMSGAVWVGDRLAAVGWRVRVAPARRVRDVAPLACKTDTVDARVLAELCRRDLVFELWVASLRDRALRERLRRRMHLVRMRASAQNRIFGLLRQWGLRLSVKRLREPDALALVEARGGEQVWRRSIAEALAVIDLLDRRIAPLEVELATLARADERVALLRTIPGVGDLLGLTIATEIGDVSRCATPRTLIGDAGLAAKVNQSGERSRIGARSKSGSRTLRWAAVEAAHQAWRETNPSHQLYLSIAARAGKNPATSAVARTVLIAAWHVLGRHQPFKPAGSSQPATVSASSRCLLAARRPRRELEKPRQLPRTLRDQPNAERDMSTTLSPGSTPTRAPPLMS
jgi:transposase